MENENDLDYGIFGQPIVSRIVDRLGDLGIYGTGGNAIDPNNFDSPYNKEINIPETFKDVILKICPEIIDIKSSGYRENVMYSPENFEQIKKYLVGVDLYFDERNGMKKSKTEYGSLLNDYFKMTYSDLDFVTFHVRSFIFPPEKSNEDKFFELFGV
jgi:hypothetical protein